MDKFSQRRLRFLETLEARQCMSAAEVAVLFAVSEATVRRMFADMERQGLLIRTRGGARRAAGPPVPPEYAPGGCAGAAAAEWIADHDIVYLEAGPAQLELARSLAARLTRGLLRDVTAVTNSMEILQLLCPACRVVLIGGEYRPARRGFAGWASEMMLVQYRFHKCFLGADGADPDAGFMTGDLETAHQNALVLSLSERAAILLDAPRFARRSLVAFAPFETVACVATGADLPPAARAALERRGIRLYCE